MFTPGVGDQNTLPTKPDKEHINIPQLSLLLCFAVCYLLNEIKYCEKSLINTLKL